MELKGGFSSRTSPVEAQSFSRPLIMEKEWEATSITLWSEGAS